MAHYATDEIDAAQEDLFTVEVMKEAIARLKLTLQIRGAELNKNAELVTELCQMFDDAVHDTIDSIVTLAKDVGAEHSRDHLVITAADREIGRAA
jgi:hypothetical protein